MSSGNFVQEQVVIPLTKLAKDSYHLLLKCSKPDRKEFLEIAYYVGIGFLLMGLVGSFVKLIHIPIIHIIIGG